MTESIKRKLFDTCTMMIDTESDEIKIPEGAELNDYIIARRDNNKEELYIKIIDFRDTFAQYGFMMFKELLSSWASEENLRNISAKLRSHPETRDYFDLGEMINLFNPNQVDNEYEIINDQTMISQINMLVDTPDGEIAKLLLSTLFSINNAKKIFTKIPGSVSEPDKAEITDLERGEHSKGSNISIDYLVDIRHIITSIFIETAAQPFQESLSNLSSRNKNIIDIIIKIKNTLITHIMVPRREYYMRSFLNAGCTGVRSRWLCNTLSKTHINCDIKTEFSPEQFQVARELIIEILNKIPSLIEISHDQPNKLIYKNADSQFMIGGKYQKKYLKYKAKYLKLKSMTK